MTDISEKTLEVLQKMTDTLEGMHTKAPANFMTATTLHGSGGIYSDSGIERNVVSAHLTPEGLISVLPLLPSVDENPHFAAFTGVGEYAGDEPDNACEDAPSGFIKAGLLTARWGMARRDTNTIDMTKVMRRVNRGEMTDLVLRGRMLGQNVAPSNLSEADVLNLVTKSEMVTTGVLIERLLTKQLWQGSFLVKNEFPGLDVQIATGQKDAETGVALPSLDSDVKNYGYGAMDTNIVEHISMIEWYLRTNARKMGLEPVNWVIAMRPDLWYELTAIWPIAYHTTRGTVAGSNSTIFINGRENVDERDAMRAGRYLDVNGNRYQVVLDDGIFEKNSTNSADLNPGEYASSVYFVPLTIAGGMPVTYRQYMDYRRMTPETALLAGKEDYFWTDNGVYTWAISKVKWCIKMHLLTEQRVILRAPHLAGRLDNVKYSPLQHLRDVDPDSPYHANGGVSLRTSVAKPYAIWSDRE